MAYYTTSEVYIFINTEPGRTGEVARELQGKGFDVRILDNFVYDIAVIFDASNKKLTALKPEICAIHGITHVDIIPAYPIKAPVPVRQHQKNATS